ncbi:unnamed protein product [Acanthoscelides obtectus]|uniref:Uncharacterized protein n=1 Tax=Acanthoscelides obtectus TaxID=200917 RepID=A0A9P0PFA1_ACAOB|nr:unnamed protein product [Acanthoscelides obtectus]CAK1642734.1 hypothetical protein AOBTE_LOCUS13188 [Acanthoscelides obtectus]
MLMTSIDENLLEKEDNIFMLVLLFSFKKQEQKIYLKVSNYHVEIVSNLKDNFKNRFKDFNEIAIVAQFVVSPFMEIDIQQFATSVTQNFREDIAATEMENLLDLIAYKTKKFGVNAINVLCNTCKESNTLNFIKIAAIIGISESPNDRKSEFVKNG